MLFYWIILELNLLLFILLWTKFITNRNNYSNWISDQLFYYFSIQSMGSFIFLLSINFNQYFYSINFNILIIIAISLKVGLFPFHFWIFKLKNYLNFFILFILLTFQKLPLIILIFNLNFEFTIYILLINIIFGSILNFRRKNLFDLLISSSIYNIIWFFFLFLISPIIFFYFLLNYFIYTYNLLEFKNLSNNIVLFFSLIFLLRLPPVIIFFFKVFTLINLLTFFNLNLILIMWLFSFLRIIGYIKTLFILNIKLENLYKINLNLRYSIKFLIILVSMFFLNLIFQNKLFLSFWVHTSNKVLTFW